MSTKVHPRDPETGQIGEEQDADEFVQEYLQENTRFIKYLAGIGGGAGG